MGQMIFESKPVPAVMRHRNGSEIAGEAKCRVRLIDSEDNALGPNFPGTVRLMRLRLGPDGLARSSPPPDLRGAADAVLPRELFDSLADDALISFHWEFEPKSQPS
jgi:hypothetical protein